MYITEPIQWVDSQQQLPDDTATVLINHPSEDEPVWLGYHEADQWYWVDGQQIPHGWVTHWADLPFGVKKN